MFLIWLHYHWPFPPLDLVTHPLFQHICCNITHLINGPRSSQAGCGYDSHASWWDSEWYDGKNAQAPRARCCSTSWEHLTVFAREVPAHMCLPSKCRVCSPHSAPRHEIYTNNWRIFYLTSVHPPLLPSLLPSFPSLHITDTVLWS